MVRKAQPCARREATSYRAMPVATAALRDSTVDAIEQHYLADKKITVLPNGFVQRGPDNEYGEFSDIVQVGTTLGPATNIAFAKVIAAVPDSGSADRFRAGTARPEN